MHEHHILGLWCRLCGGGARKKRTRGTGSHGADERPTIHQISMPNFILVVHRSSPLRMMWLWLIEVLPNALLRSAFRSPWG
jgi:hypothetical protein